MISVKKTTAFTALILTAIISLTGCGSKAADDSALGSAGAGATTETRTAGQPFTPENFTERITAAQLKARSAHISISQDLAGTKVDMSGKIQLAKNVDDIRMQLEMSFPDEDAVDIIVVSPTEVYMNMGEKADGKFLQMPEAAVTSIGLSQYVSMGDPAAQLESWTNALSNFKATDGKKIDGVNTQKISLTLDTRKLLENTSGALKGIPEDTLTETIDGLVDALGKETTAEFYIGEDDLPRRLVTNLSGTPSTTNFSQWGKPVNISAPTGDQLLSDAEAKKLIMG